jgi:hypothetical protein
MGPIVTAVKNSIECSELNETHFSKNSTYVDLIDKWKAWLPYGDLSSAHYANWRSCDIDSDSSMPRYKVSLTVKNYFAYAEPGENLWNIF